MKSALIILMTLVLIGPLVRAESNKDDSTIVSDTVLFNQTSLLDNVSPIDDPENFEYNLTQKPTVALFKSMVVPGWGQWGNKRRFKTVLFLGLETWMVGSAIHYGRQASDFKSLYDNATELTVRLDYYALYSDRKDERNKFTWFAVIVSFISMFDAYVDAHLSGHPAEQHQREIAVDFKPVANDGFQVTLSLDF